MQTETLDKLYLEWSQFTKAKTGRECELEAALEGLLNAMDRYGVKHLDSDDNPPEVGQIMAASNIARRVLSRSDV